MNSFWPSQQVPSLLPLLPQKCVVEFIFRYRIFLLVINNP